MEANVPLSLGRLTIKVKSKRELYLLSINDWEIDMPQMQDSNSEYVCRIVTELTKVGLESVLFNFWIVCEDKRPENNLSSFSKSLINAIYMTLAVEI